MSRIDTSIYNNLQPTVKLQTPFELEAGYQQIQQGQNQNRLSQMQFQEADRVNTERNALAGIAQQHGNNPEAYGNALMQGGFVKQYQDFTKQQNDTAMSGVELKNKQSAGRKAEVENMLQMLTATEQILRGVNDQASYDAALPQLRALHKPEDQDKIPAVYDPAAIARGQQQALPLKSKLELEMQERSLAYRQQNDAASRDVTMRGQDLTDARGREANVLKGREVGILGGKQAFDAEGKMGDDYKAQSKEFVAVRDGYTRLNASLKHATKSAAATLAGATSFMKLLDPGSVVRESELGLALQASGVIDRATNYYNTLKLGKVLTPSQAKDFENIGAQIYQAAEANQKSLEAQYTERAGRYGLNPKNIISDYSIKQPAATKTIKRTGTVNGKKVVEYSDGSVEYAK